MAKKTESNIWEELDQAADAEVDEKVVSSSTSNGGIFFMVTVLGCCVLVGGFLAGAQYVSQTVIPKKLQPHIDQVAEFERLLTTQAEMLARQDAVINLYNDYAYSYATNTVTHGAYGYALRPPSGPADSLAHTLHVTANGTTTEAQYQFTPTDQIVVVNDEQSILLAAIDNVVSLLVLTDQGLQVYELTMPDDTLSVRQQFWCESGCVQPIIWHLTQYKGEMVARIDLHHATTTATLATQYEELQDAVIEGDNATLMVELQELQATMNYADTMTVSLVQYLKH